MTHHTKRFLCLAVLSALLWSNPHHASARFCNNDPVNEVDPLGLAGYFFDGTWINKDDPKEPVESNVGKLSEEYKGRKFYREGVGSTGSWWSRFWGGFAGSGWEERLKLMYSKLVQTYNDDSDPENKQIDIFGFSRGGAMARDFANMIQEKGVLYKGKKVFPKVRFLGVFDTVASKGIPGNDVNAGSDLSLASNVIAAAHAMSRHETRGTFPLTRFKPDPRVEEAWFAGVHSDVGGAYPVGRTQGYISLYFMYLKAWEAGVPLGDFPREYWQAIARYRIYQNVDLNNLWTAERNGIKVDPMHDSTDSVIYYPDKITRSIRTLMGADRYHRTIYEH